MTCFFYHCSYTKKQKSKRVAFRWLLSIFIAVVRLQAIGFRDARHRLFKSYVNRLELIFQEMLTLPFQKERILKILSHIVSLSTLDIILDGDTRRTLKACNYIENYYYSGFIIFPTMTKSRYAVVIALLNSPVAYYMMQLTQKRHQTSKVTVVKSFFQMTTNIDQCQQLSQQWKSTEFALERCVTLRS